MDAFLAKCYIDKSGDMYGYSGELSFMVFDRGNDVWEAKNWNGNLTFTLTDNDKYYYFFPIFGGNIKFIIRIDCITENYISFEYFNHDLGNYGRDYFDKGKEHIKMNYNEKEKCFEFYFYGNWRLYPDRLEFSKSTNSRPDYYRVVAINPNNYWWFEKAKNS